MYQLIAIGDITVDLFFQGESLKQEADRFSLAIGGKYYADAFHYGLGGSAANVSIHAAQLGLDAAAVSRVGENAFKNMIVQGLARKSVSTEFLYFDREHISISSILLSPSGERTIIKYSDPKEQIDIGDHALDRIKRSGIVFLGNLPYVPIADRMKFMKSVKSDSNLLALNFGAKECAKGIAKLKPLIETADIVFLNKYEFAGLIGVNPETLALTQNQHTVLGAAVQLLVVTDGPRGSYAYSASDVFVQSSARVQKVVDTTGAGDAFTAAFLVKYADSSNPQVALEAASEYAGKVVSKLGAH